MILVGQFFVRLLIDGDEYQIAPGNFDNIMTIQNVCQKVPTCVLRLRDYNGALLDNGGPLEDGSQIVLEFGRSSEREDVQSVAFTSIGSPSMQEIPCGVSHEIRGMLDVPKYWELAKKPYEMTSSDALAQIAQASEMTAEVDSANDKTIWRPNRVSNWQFATNIAQKGWAGDSSIFQFAVTENKVLRYVNLEQAIKRTPKVTFAFNSNARGAKGRVVPVLSRTLRTIGTSNVALNYGAKASRENMDGSNTEQKDFAAPKGSGWFNISSRMKGKVEENKVKSIALPPDYGNTSDKYDKGMYQNFRGLNTFTNIVYVMVMEASDVNLLDLVEYSEGGQDNKPKAALNGNYFVTGKTRFIQGTHYYEKLELSSQGVSSNPRGKLI